MYSKSERKNLLPVFLGRERSVKELEDDLRSCFHEF